MRASSVDQIILETLDRKNSHLTSHQVFEEIRQRLPAVNPSTVYRALERLARHGRISVSDIGMGSAVYESVSDEPHHHLVCQSCGGVFMLEHNDVDVFFQTVQQKSQFQISTNHLILFGVCKGCQDE